MAEDSIFYSKTNLLLIHTIQGELVIPRDSAIKSMVRSHIFLIVMTILVNGS